MIKRNETRASIIETQNREREFWSSSTVISRPGVGKSDSQHDNLIAGVSVVKTRLRSIPTGA